MVDVPFLLMADIRSSSPWPLLLASSSLQMLTISSNTPQTLSQLQGGTTGFLKKKTLFSFQIFYWNNGHFLNVGVCSVVLQTGECATECFCLRCPPLKSDSSIAIATGQYVLLWRRYVFPDTHTKRKKS